MQAINEVFEGKTHEAPFPVHGKTCLVHHEGDSIFHGLPSPFRAARYHSLCIEIRSDAVVPLAFAPEGVHMGIRHRFRPIFGVQFHPESFMTEYGIELVQEFSERKAGLARRSPRPQTKLTGFPGPIFVPQQLQRAGLIMIRPLHGFRIPFTWIGWKLSKKLMKRDFLSQAEIHASENPSALLLSGGELRPGGENRYSIAARDPFLTLRGKGNLTRIETAGGSFEICENPISVLDRLCESMHPRFGPSVPPFCGGAVGYFAYDLKNSIESLPTSACDDLDLPDLFIFWPARIEVYDRKQRKLSRIVLRPEGERCSRGKFPLPFYTEPAPDARMSVGRSRGEKGDFVRNWFEVGPLQSNFTHDDYLAAVSRVRDYIRRGDVYQVNLSQRFQFSLKGDPFRLWKSLFDINPAPFYAYINAGDHRILSTSMERFLFRKDGFIETRPIKGTRRRGHTRQEDEALVADLLSSPKDDAELSMIVDLMRNDLGRICSPGTVRVR